MAVLVVEDNPSVASLLQRGLERDGYSVDLAAYRVVQEALTNTLKYAGPAQAWVQICWTPDELRIEVANNGLSTASGTGYGQAGMRERVRLYGGRVESGPRPDGGYVVRAFVPIGAAE